MTQSLENEILESILSKSGKSPLDTILKEQIPINSEILLIAYHDSGFQPTSDYIKPKDHRWIQALAFSKDDKTKDILKELFLTEPRHKGAILLALWFQDVQAAKYWLIRIKTFDPLFRTIKLGHSPFVTSLTQKYHCKEADIFENLLLSHQHASDSEQKQYLDSMFNRINKSQKNYEVALPDDRKNYMQMVEEREKVIQSGTLDSEFGDQLFSTLWESVALRMEETSTDILNRKINTVFEVVRGEDSVSLKYDHEIKHLLLLIPYVSSAHHPKIIHLYQNLPFWIKDRGFLARFGQLQEFMLEYNPSQVVADWKELLEEDLKLGHPKGVASGGWGAFPRGFPFRPDEPALVDGVTKIVPYLDLDFLTNLTNHYSEKIRILIRAEIRRRLAQQR